MASITQGHVRPTKSKWDIQVPELFPPPPPADFRLSTRSTSAGIDNNLHNRFPPNPPALSNQPSAMERPLPPPPLPPPVPAPPPVPPPRALVTLIQDVTTVKSGSNEHASNGRSRSPMRRQRRSQIDGDPESGEKARGAGNERCRSRGLLATTESKVIYEAAPERGESEKHKAGIGDVQSVATPARSNPVSEDSKASKSRLLVDAFAPAPVQYHSFEHFEPAGRPHGTVEPPPALIVQRPPTPPRAERLKPEQSGKSKRDDDEDSDDPAAAQRRQEESSRRIIAAIPEETRQRLERFIEEGTIRAIYEFDSKSLSDLIALPVAMQGMVLDHVEAQKVFLLNSRSKSGFLVSVCERARHGALDCRGYFQKDPWKDHLNAVAIPKRSQIEFHPEKVWLKDHGAAPARLLIDMSAVSDRAGLGPGVQTISLVVSLADTVRNVKQRLVAIGVEIPVNKMKLRALPAGFLKDTRTLAFYNIASNAELQLFYQTRAGVARKKDHSDGFDPRFCETGFAENYSCKSVCSAEEYVNWAISQHSQLPAPRPGAWGNAVM